MIWLGLKLEEHNLSELSKGEKSSFEDSIVSLEGVFSFSIDENVSLAKYLSYQRSALKKSKESKTK